MIKPLALVAACILLLSSCNNSSHLDSSKTEGGFSAFSSQNDSSLFGSSSSQDDRVQELLADPFFENGFDLKSTTTLDGSLVVRHLDYDGKANEASWKMAQWWTPFDFKNAPYTYKDGRHTYENESRFLGVDTEKGEMEMGLDSYKEYLELFGGSRTKGSQNWSHFLIEQNFPKAVPLSSLEKLYLKLNFGIYEVSNEDEENYSPSIHAAQFVLYFTIRNVKENKFFWFGLPFYDNRGSGYSDEYSIDSGFVGATNTLIYKMGRKSFLEDKLPVIGKEYALNVDVLPYMVDAFLFGATDSAIGMPYIDWKMEDLVVDYLNFGWELPGSFKVDSRFSGLSVEAHYL